MSKTEVFVMADESVPKGMCKYQVEDGSWHLVPIKMAVYIMDLEEQLDELRVEIDMLNKEWRTKT